MKRSDCDDEQSLLSTEMMKICSLHEFNGSYWRLSSCHTIIDGGDFQPGSQPSVQRNFGMTNDSETECLQLNRSHCQGEKKNGGKLDLHLFPVTPTKIVNFS